MKFFFSAALLTISKQLKKELRSDLKKLHVNTSIWKILIQSSMFGKKNHSERERWFLRPCTHPFGSCRGLSPLRMWTMCV